MSRTVRTRIACVVSAALVISWGGPAANAFWQTLSSNAGAAQADFIPAVPAPTASVSPASAAVSWVQGSTAAGRPVAGYTVARYASATDGTKVAAGGGCAGTVTALACTESGLPGGTWYYTVTPILASWQGVESARSSGATAADTTPPNTPTITAPAMITKATVDKVPVSGTAEALSSVTVTVKDAGAAHTVSQTVTASSSGQWTAADFDLTTFNDPTITYSAVATDAAGNASVVPGTATSSKDATGPKVTNLMLFNGGSNNNIDPGDQVVLTFSEALDPSTICSNWSPTGGDQTVNGSEQVTVNVSTDDILTVTGPGCGTESIGSVALDGNYAVAGALSFHGTGINGSKVSSLAWNATTFQLTITLGSREGTPSSVSQPGNHRYNPATGLTDSVGNALSTLTYTGPRSKF